MEMGSALAAGFGTSYPRPVTASIVINNYNYGRFVGRAIDSALDQTCQCQVVVVDDGSTDDSRERIAPFSRSITAIFQANGGQAAAMNAGFAAATGDVVVFLDADDTLEPHAVASLLAAWQPRSVLVQYLLRIVDAEGRVVGVHPDPPDALAQGDARSTLLAHGGYGATVTSGLAFRRMALAAVMPIPLEPYRIAADGYLVRAIAFTGPVQRLLRVLGSYRRHAFNGTRVGGPSDVADAMRMRIGWALREFATTRQLAVRFGLTVRPGAGEDGADFLGYLLGLRLTAPHDPRVADHSAWDALRRYVSVRWSSPWPFSRRVMAVVLAGAATCAPPAIAAVLVHWLQDADARPAWARRLSHLMRRRGLARLDPPASSGATEKPRAVAIADAARRLPPRAPRAS